MEVAVHEVGRAATPAHRTFVGMEEASYPVTLVADGENPYVTG